MIFRKPEVEYFSRQGWTGRRNSETQKQGDLPVVQSRARIAARAALGSGIGSGRLRRFRSTHSLVRAGLGTIALDRFYGDRNDPAV